jgi:hypothetical protein
MNYEMNIIHFWNRYKKITTEYTLCPLDYRYSLLYRTINLGGGQVNSKGIILVQNAPMPRYNGYFKPVSDYRLV